MKIKVGDKWFDFKDSEIDSIDGDGNITWSSKLHWKIIRNRPSRIDGFIDKGEFIDHNEIYFKEMIEYKNVIYVGPSEILRGRGMGKFIDSFDVVIRSNNSYPVPEHLQMDYGSRCDVIYTNTFFSNIIDRLVNKDIYRDILICSKCKKIKGVKNRVFRLRNTEYLIDGKIHLTGNYTYLDILDKNPNKLYITGVSLYLDSKHHLDEFEYRDDNQKMFYKFHDHNQEILLFVNNIMNKDNVEVDNFLIDLIERNKKI